MSFKVAPSVPPAERASDASPFTLVAATGSDKASMVGVVDDLERARLVVRRPVPG